MSNAEHPSAQRLPSAYGGGKRRGQARRAHTVGKVVLASVVTLAMITGLSVAFFYRHLNGNLNVEDLEAQLGTDRPEEVEVEGPKDPMNILVMGSDSRDCDGCDIDGESTGTGLSDTTILIHLSADRQSAYGISIPRDSLVDRPECIDEDGDTIPGATAAQWNIAFSVGGPACTIRQFEQLTGVRVNNYVVVDFQGFQDMVDALGGVQVCVPQDIDDREHGIVIKAGTREISGKEALSYVRVRHVEGTDGSDIQRIKRQQAFVAAMANKVISGSILARPDQLFGFLDAATDSLTTDIENIGRMARIAYEFKDTGLKRIQFITVPWQYAPSDPNRVEWLPEAEELWEKVKNDTPLGKFRGEAITAGDVPGSTTPPPSTSESESESESPSESESESPSESTQSPSEGSSPSESASEQSEAEAAEAAREAREAAGLCV